jgi:hypothetical protein
VGVRAYILSIQTNKTVNTRLNGCHILILFRFILHVLISITSAHINSRVLTVRRSKKRNNESACRRNDWCMSCKVDCVRKVNEFFFLMNSSSFNVYTFHRLMMMKIFLIIEPMTTWINPSSHKFIFDYSMLSSMNSVIREYVWVSVYLAIDDNLCLPIILMYTQSSIYHSLTLIGTRVHKWFSFLVEMSVILMIDKHIVTAVRLRFRLKTRHAPFLFSTLIEHDIEIEYR